jgi:hypothetical protein
MNHRAFVQTMIALASASLGPVAAPAERGYHGARPFLFGRRCGKLAVKLEAERLDNGNGGAAQGSASEDSAKAGGNGR